MQKLQDGRVPYGSELNNNPRPVSPATCKPYRKPAYKHPTRYNIAPGAFALHSAPHGLTRPRDVLHNMKATTKTCKNCALPLQARASVRAQNVVYCDVECRKAYYKANPSPSHTKEATDARNHTMWNTYKPGKTQCEDCNGWYYGIAYHTTQRHGITASDYKAIHGLNRGAGLIPEATKNRKAQATRDNGTINNLKKGAHARYTPGDPRAGQYERRAQTLATLTANMAKGRATRKAIANDPGPDQPNQGGKIK